MSYPFRLKAVLGKKQSGEESEDIKCEIIRQQQGEAAWGTRACYLGTICWSFGTGQARI